MRLFVMNMKQLHTKQSIEEENKDILERKKKRKDREITLYKKIVCDENYEKKAKCLTYCYVWRDFKMSKIVI